MSSPLIGSKIIPLREVIDVQFAKADMIIHDSSSDKQTKTADDEEEFDKLA